MAHEVRLMLMLLCVGMTSYSCANGFLRPQNAGLKFLSHVFYMPIRINGTPQGHGTQLKEYE